MNNYDGRLRWWRNTSALAIEAAATVHANVPNVHLASRHGQIEYRQDGLQLFSDATVPNVYEAHWDSPETALAVESAALRIASEIDGVVADAIDKAGDASRVCVWFRTIPSEHPHLTWTVCAGVVPVRVHRSYNITYLREELTFDVLYGVEIREKAEQ